MEGKLENDEYGSRWLKIKARIEAASTRKGKSMREKTTGPLYNGGRQGEVRGVEDYYLRRHVRVYAINWKSKHMAYWPCGHGSMGRKARKTNKKHDDDGEQYP